MTKQSSFFAWAKCAFLLAVCACTISASAQKYTQPSSPVIGSENTVTADPHVPRPSTTPCVVPLFTNYVFADFSSKFFTYAPPACAAPWSKVVLEATFSVTAGRQFDRTANIWIGGTNVYFGTTSEPSRTVAREWHIESDLTDYAPLFVSPQAGKVDLGNLVNSTYTGILYGSAQLLFYPVASGASAPRTADAVLPLSAGATGGSVLLFSPSDSLAKTFSPPRNVERAYLDVIAQSQSGDEFWYTCVPNELTGPLQSCGATAFRETEVYVDGQPAGVAPVYPWIYTGGIDPYLWRPIVGIETLNFSPYRVDLTPFAGLLSDGNQHTVSLKVYNANSYFATTATLLLYQDAGSAQVTGAVTDNTIGSANPVVTNNITLDSSGDATGTLSVTSDRQFKVAGYVNTSHGKVETQIVQHISFSNVQQFTINADIYKQSIAQNTSITSNTMNKTKGSNQVTTSEQQWPLNLTYSFFANADGSYAQPTVIQQGLSRHEVQTGSGGPAYVTDLNITNAPADTLVFGNTVFPQDQSGTQRYVYKDNRGACWDRKIDAAGGSLTNVTDGCKK